MPNQPPDQKFSVLYGQYFDTLTKGKEVEGLTMMPIPIEDIYQQHNTISQCHIEEDKLIRDWDTWLLKGFLIFLIALFVIFIFSEQKPIEELLPILTLIGACSTVTLLATHLVTAPIERRRAAIEKEGILVENQYFEITSFKYFRVIAEERSLRFKNEVSLRLLPFLCSAGGTIASTSALYTKNGGNLTFFVPIIGSISIAAVTIIVIRGCKRRQSINNK